MFKFTRIISGGGKWTDQLFLEDEHIGALGLNEEGLFLESNKKFTLIEINLLIGQLTSSNPDLLNKEIKFLPYKL